MLEEQYSKSTLIQTKGPEFLITSSINEEQFLGNFQFKVNYLHALAKIHTFSHFYLFLV